MPRRRRFVVERASTPTTTSTVGTVDYTTNGISDGTWRYLFTDCPICTKCISDEARHTCELTWQQQHDRDTSRALKVTEMATRRVVLRSTERPI